MHVIPVIDLKSGVVVRAVAGDRANYRPIDTPLAPASCDPIDVVKGLTAFCDDFEWLYVADLDGIEVRGRDRDTIQRLCDAFPQLRFLVDDGSATLRDISAFADHPRITPVIGSESLRSLQQLAAIADRLRGEIALSLDWRAGRRLGPDELFDDSSHWPNTLIVMSLDRVGLREGPDLDRLNEVKSRAGDRQVLAAGGVRNVDDLRSVHQLGCGALIASCLHDGTITRGSLATLLGL